MIGLARWVIGTTAVRLLIGAVAFFIWLQVHDAKIRNTEREAVQAEQERLALRRVQNLENNNADFNKLSDRDRCLVFMRDSSLPERECDKR